MSLVYQVSVDQGTYGITAMSFAEVFDFLDLAWQLRSDDFFQILKKILENVQKIKLLKIFKGIISVVSYTSLCSGILIFILWFLVKIYPELGKVNLR